MTYGELKEWSMRTWTQIDGAMTMGGIKERVMFQTNNDADDLGDFLPHLDSYINDGYDRIVNVWIKQHVPSVHYPTLAADGNIPNIPTWMHRYIADWATWLVYRNGNPQKQQRGMAYYNAFMDMLSKIADEGGLNAIDEDGNRKAYRNFINVPS